MKRAHLISGILLLAMLLIMLMPQALVYEERSANGLGLHYIDGSYLGVGVNLQLDAFPAFTWVLTAVWAVYTLAERDKRRGIRLILGALCLLIHVLIMTRARMGGPTLLCALGGVAMLIQTGSYCLGRISPRKRKE